MTLPPIVGLSGWAGAGKDTVGQMLVDLHGYRRVAFADKLKELLAYTLHGEWDKELVECRKSLHREHLQRLGEGCRQAFWETIWVDAALADTDEAQRLVVTDVRYRNEAETIVGEGGEVWRIVRPGQGPVNNHASERDLDDWEFDRTIVNGGSLSDLFDKVADYG